MFRIYQRMQNEIRESRDGCRWTKQLVQLGRTRVSRNCRLGKPRNLAELAFMRLGATRSNRPVKYTNLTDLNLSLCVLKSALEVPKKHIIATFLDYFVSGSNRVYWWAVPDKIIAVPSDFLSPIVTVNEAVNDLL